MKDPISVDPEEIARFSAMADEWWDPKGKFRPLHELGSTRIGWIRDRITAHFRKDAHGAEPLAGLNILDIGCGGGLVAEPLARMGAHVTGVDASEKNIGVATLHAQQSGVQVHYRHAAAEDLVAEKAQFDIVCALEIVEHVADVGAFMQAISTLMKPGGLLLMSTLNRTPKSYLLAIVGAEYVMRWLPVGTHSWKKFLRPSELCYHLRTYGLELQSLCGMRYDPLRSSWALSEQDLSVNYLLAAHKPS